MLDLNPVVLGIILIAIGAGFYILTLTLLRMTPRLRAATKSLSSPVSIQVPEHHEAVLLVQSGGRVVYMNQPARELFNLWEEEPNLESLARRTRPSESFLTLCAAESQARFSLNGRFVEGTSYFAPAAGRNGSDQPDAMLISLRRPEIMFEGETRQVPPANQGEQDQARASQSETSSRAFGIFSELSQTITSSLDLETTLQAILESIERLIPSDILEINVWEEDRQHLIPYRLVGIAGVDRRLEKAPERYQPDQGYTGYLISSHEPLLVEDVNTFRLVHPALDRQRYPFQSFMGLPMLLAGKLIGTIELASLSKANYSENDLQILRLLSGQAVIALNNSLLYEQEEKRLTELTGLANLAQTVSSIRDPQDLYTRLVDSISPLLDVEILGFLVYDENRHVLEGKIPFKGIQPNVIEWYQTTILPDSPAEALWLSSEAILTANAPEDPRMVTLGLHHLALAAGLRNTALVPMTTGGHTLGYLQAANKRDGSAFEQNDLRFLSIIAGQAAPIIENANLVQQSKRRAQRAETLRRIASLTSSAATLDEILKFSIMDLARLLQADMAVAFLLDEAHGELRLHKASTFGVSPELAAHLIRIPIDDPQFKKTVTGSKRQFVSQTMEESTELLPLYQAMVDDLEIQSVIDIPLISRERGIGELMVGSFKPNFFSHGDVQTVATASGQLAAAIEQSALYSQTDHSLRQRVDQLTALTRISRELNATLQLEPLLERVYDEALRTTRAECGTVLLFELGETVDGRLIYINQAVPGHPNVFSPRIQLYFGEAPGDELEPLERLVLDDGETRILDEFENEAPGTEQEEPGRSENDGEKEIRQMQPAHPGIRSALVIPIAYQGQVAGLIHLHSKEPYHFGETEQEIGESLAIQAAIALGNTHRYQEQKRRTEQLNRRVETLSRLLEVSQVLQSEQPLEEALESIAYAIQASTPFDVVLVSIYDPARNQLLRVTGAGIPLETMKELRTHTQPWSSMQIMLSPEFRMGQAYFIPSEQSSAVPTDIHTVVISLSGAVSQANSWDPQDLLLIPLYSAEDQPLGLISVDVPRDNLRPDRSTIETLEIFASQAALVIETRQKVGKLRTQVDKMQGELELAQESARQAQTHLPSLLHKDLEQTLAIHHLSQRSRRINAGLDIAEAVNQQESHAEVLLFLAQETLARMDFDLVLLAEPTAGGLNLLHSIGAIPAEVNPKALLGQRNPLRHCLQTGAITLVANLEEDLEWQSAPLLRALEARSFICLPIHNASTLAKSPSQPGENETQAAMLAISKSSQAPFTDDDEQLFGLLARQVAIALQNLRLMEDTTRRLREVNLLLDFSRQLGSLDPTSILDTLVESALKVAPSAEMAMVALWDARQGQLIPRVAKGYPSNEGLLQILYRPGEGIPGQVFEQRRAFRLDEVEFARHYNLSPENLLYYRNATGGRLPVSSLAVPILASRGETGLADQAGAPGRKSDTIVTTIEESRGIPLGVLVLDSSKTTAAFTEDHLALVASLAQQTALTLENARLYQSSEQRSNQLQSLTDVSTTITSSLQPDQLIAIILNQLQGILSYDTGTLWLRQAGEAVRPGGNTPERMVVQAAVGFEDSEQRIGLTVDVQDSVLLNEMINTGKPISVGNVTQDARFSALSLMEMMDETSAPASGYERLSWLGVPLISSGKVIGVIALEKTEPNFYTQDDIQVATAFAIQAAASLENAQLYQDSLKRAMELDQRSQTLSILNRLSSELSSSLDAKQILDFAVREFLQILPCSSVSVLGFEGEGEEYEVPDFTRSAEPLLGQVTLQTEFSNIDLEPDSAFDPSLPIPHTPLFDRLRETMGVFSTDDIHQEPELQPLQEFLTRYKTQSLLIVPIVSAGLAEGETTATQNFQGLLLAHNDQQYHYSADELRLARTIANQIAISLQNARLTEDLELRVQQRTAELVHEQQRAETLLRIITELSASLDLDQVLHRTLQVLSEYVDADQIIILIARPGEKKLHRLASVGYVPTPIEEDAPSTLDIDQGLAGWIIAQRQSVMVDDLLQDDRWIHITYVNGSQQVSYPHRSALGVPLMSGAEALGCLLLFHSSIGHFSVDQLDLVQAAANQVAVAVNNAELYRLIRDQAEDLGTMLRNQQVETSRSKAILEAVADGVLVTDTNRRITLFNESAEKILVLPRTQVLGKSMEQFIGLFGRATQSWMERINTWSIDPSTYQPGDTYSEQFSLEDGRVISVHLAPVSLRNDFLGTVSIFQDVTQQVEVDRLKSEFVATVSHELRTPMTSIKGYVEILLMGAAGKLTEQQAHFLQVVKNNTERLSVLVNDLLDVSQIEAGRVVLSMQPLGLEEICDQVIGDLLRRSREEDKPIEIEKDIEPNLPRIYGDAERVRQILDNLMDNAYQYNTPNGKIKIQMRQMEDEIQVDVIDNGFGIHPEDAPRVFERFFRGENTLVLGVSGTGLGLSITSNLIEMHKGRIWLESTGVPGEGSKFSFTLPVYKPEEG
ncbi:MAG: GAF domain-containing protein [Anaerolineales bacterium]|nr:GAF domain-containing protein [Anaerolineales bacterium]